MRNRNIEREREIEREKEVDGEGENICVGVFKIGKDLFVVVPSFLPIIC